MLNIHVENFRGIKIADLQCSPIALLAGQNEQGKSSIIDAVRSVLDGTEQPYGLTKAELPQLLHTGSEVAVVIIKQDDGENGRKMAMRWPSAEIATAGMPFRATNFATGSKRLTDLDPRTRAQVLAQYLQTDPTREEFEKALENSGLTEAQIGDVWKDITALGWDGAWAKHKTECTKLKGAWEQITGASYGIKVGGNWRPKGWGPDHEAMTDADIKKFIDEDQAALDAAIGKIALNEDEKKKLEAAVRNIPKLEELLETKTADGARAKSNLEKAEGDFRKIPVLPPGTWPTCPHCSKPVQVLAGKNGESALRIPPKELDEAERKKIESQVDTANRVLNDAREAYQTAQASWTTINNDLKKAQDGKAMLEQVEPGAEKINLEELRGNLANSKAMEAGRAKVRQALQKHIEVVTKLNIAVTLAPDGLRKTKLVTKLAEFNERLKELCDVAGWGGVVVDENGDATLAGRKYDLCARSGRMRIDATLQVLFAIIDGSEVILIDDADMLDGKGRNGLFALLAHSELYAIVGMMLTKMAQAPDLAAAEIGETLWIDNAVATPLEEIKARAA